VIGAQVGLVVTMVDLVRDVMNERVSIRDSSPTRVKERDAGRAINDSYPSHKSSMREREGVTPKR
jgi:hypothetical protein